VSSNLAWSPIRVQNRDIRTAAILADCHGSERGVVAKYPDLPIACLNIGSLGLLANELREGLQPSRSAGSLVRA
jgi:hypothetical protein